MSAGEERADHKYSTAEKGELALLRVLQRALEKGWITSRPTRECRYDLILDDGRRLYRVQVKYCGRRAFNCQGAVNLDFTMGGRKNAGYSHEEVDAVVVYVAPSETLVWLEPELFHGRKNIQLRYAATLSGQKQRCLLISDFAW